MKPFSISVYLQQHHFHFYNEERLFCFYNEPNQLSTKEHHAWMDRLNGLVSPSGEIFSQRRSFSTLKMTFLRRHTKIPNINLSLASHLFKLQSILGKSSPSCGIVQYHVVKYLISTRSKSIFLIIISKSLLTTQENAKQRCAFLCIL